MAHGRRRPAEESSSPRGALPPESTPPRARRKLDRPRRRSRAPGAAACSASDSDENSSPPAPAVTAPQSATDTRTTVGRTAGRRRGSAAGGAGPVLAPGTTFKLRHIIRPHSTSPAGALDDKVQVWCCAFRPSADDRDPELLATCGGRSVCLVDCETGKVCAKYTHLEELEEFYALDWTTLEAERGSKARRAGKPHVVLAAAGHLATVRLINTLQATCYRYLRGHKQAVRMVAFAKRNPRWLLSTSDDKSIRLWDVGTVGGEDDDDSSCLAVFESRDKVYSFSFGLEESTVLCGTHSGSILAYALPKMLQSACRTRCRDSCTTSAEPTAVLGPGSLHTSAVDCVAALELAGQCAWLTKSVDGKGILWGTGLGSLGCGGQLGKDMDVLMRFETETCEQTFMRFSLAVDTDGTAVVVGTGDGDVLIYELKAAENRGPVEPCKLLSHPQSDGAVRDVAVNGNGTVIAAVDSRNRLFIWKAAQ